MKQNLLRISGAVVNFDKSGSSCFKTRRKRLVFKDVFIKWEAILTWYTSLLYFSCCKEEQRGKISRAYLWHTNTAKSTNWWLREDSADEVWQRFPGRTTGVTPTQISPEGFAAQPEFGDFIRTFAEEGNETACLSMGCLGTAIPYRLLWVCF